MQGIPPKFVKNYISEVEMGSSVTVLLSPLSKFCRVTVGKDQSSGNLFFSGGWSRFLASNGITEYDVLLLRYEGNIVFLTAARKATRTKAPVARNKSRVVRRVGF